LRCDPDQQVVTAERGDELDPDLEALGGSMKRQGDRRLTGHVELGVLLLKSKIPLNFIELVSIFVIRTLITLPLVTFIARAFVF